MNVRFSFKADFMSAIEEVLYFSKFYGDSIMMLQKQTGGPKK